MINLNYFCKNKLIRKNRNAKNKCAFFPYLPQNTNKYSEQIYENDIDN